MSLFSRLSPYWLWALLALPAYGLLSEYAGSTDPKIIDQMMHGTGEFAARFMIISMMATPLMMLFKGWRGPRWLVKNRRYFGVAAFGYAALHLMFYVIDTATLAKILSEATKLENLTGWLAFAIFLLLAATSFDWAVRKLGRNWKSLQRVIYVAAGLIVLHWLLVSEFKAVGPVIVHFTPLALLTLYRLWWNFLRPRNRPAMA